MPRKFQDDVVQEVHGVYANQQLLALLMDMIGREVVVDARDGSRFEGIFVACSPQFEMGLKYAHQLPSLDEMKDLADDQKKLLPHKDEVIEKMQFEKDDVVCVTAVMRDERRIEGFATDREYASRNGQVINLELQAWEIEDDFDDTPLLTDDQQDGWSAEQMFQANNILGVKSTFDENMLEYTTADVQGDSEDFKRAERIAQEINNSSASKARALLENDDEERDLDKETPEFQIQQSRKTPGIGRGGYCGNVRDRGGSNMNRVPPSGRRSEGVANVGRAKLPGRGPFGSTGTSSRSFTNSSLGHGMRAPNAATSGAGSRYAPAGIMERPSAQEVHVQFGQWARRNENSSGAVSATDNVRNGRKSEPLVGNTCNVGNTRVYEPRIANHHEGSRAGEENKNLHHSGSPHGFGGIARQQTSRQTERIRNLREFQQTFNSTYQPSHSARTSSDDDQRVIAIQGSASLVATSKPVSNAWNKGPPASIRSSASSTQVIANQHSARDTEGAADLSSSDQRFPPSVARTRGSTQTPLSSNGHLNTTAAVSVEATTSVSEVRQGRSAGTSTVVTSRAASPPTMSSTSPNIAATPISDVQASTVASTTTRDIQQTQLSAAASSSSIAPTDPTPSTTATQNDAAKIPVAGAVTTTSDGKQFIWNPDAPSFTPRGFTLVALRNAEQQQNLRSAVHNVRTPPAAPQPLMSAHIAAPTQIQGLTIANPQGLSVQNVQSIAHAGPPQMFPHAHANAYGTSMPVYYNASVVQTASHASTAATPTAAANVTGGPIVASTTGLSIARQSQIIGQTASGNRRNQQQHQQLVQNAAAGVYVPGAAQPYTQQLMSQYQMPYFAPYPPQLSMGVSANMPPPPIPPPTTNAVLSAPPPYQIIQAQTQQQAVGYPRQFYHGEQSVNYMMSRYPQPHTIVDYSAATTVANAQHMTQQQPQIASSTTSSNGTGSNGHNSQPATPGPVTSPAQVQQHNQHQQQSVISQYPQCRTPQSPHTVLVHLQPGAAPSNPQPHVYVQAPHFPFIATGQPSYVMTYGPQPVVVHPSVAAAHVPFSQAHQTHGQPGAVEHYQGASAEQAISPQVPNALHQSYVASASDQFYGHYIHAQQQQHVLYQQQTGNTGMSRHNSINSGTNGTHHQQQPFQPGAVTQNSSAAPNSNN